jgi:hypothetical protein
MLPHVVLPLARADWPVVPSWKRFYASASSSAANAMREGGRVVRLAGWGWQGRRNGCGE